MRIAALVLAVVILPLAVFAAVSMGLRLNQYGLAPERRWGLVAIVVACAWGIGYWIALARGGRHGWAGKLRAANFHLALGGCVLALLLALPIFDFGAISTRNQVARLESGKVSPEQFDFAALRWDFGEPGQKALERLGKSGNTKVAEFAGLALKQTQRPYYGLDRTIRTAADINLRVQPENLVIHKLVIDYLLTNPSACTEFCVALDLGSGETGKREVALVSSVGYERVSLPDETPKVGSAKYEIPPKLGPTSTVEIREVPTRYIFVDGKPVGPPLD
jgi:hypothetical protein